MFVILLSCWFATRGHAGIVEDNKVFVFDIPTQPADTALNLFGSQTGVSIVYQYDLVNQHISNALVGAHDLADGMAILLRDTGLTANIMPEGFVVILAESVQQVEAEPDVGAEGNKAVSAANTLEEITVTAQFRETNLQTTPVAITALTHAELENRTIDNLGQLNGLAPNLLITPGNPNQGPSATVFLRGIGQFDASYALEPGVGIYVDDVYHGTLMGSLLDLFDVERIEVLRGPQGTLAGKNSIGGAIKVFTARPGNTSGGYLSATTGDYDRFDFKGSFNYPLIDEQLFVRLGAMTRYRDGHVTRKDFACVNPDMTYEGILQPIDPTDCELGREGGTDVTSWRLGLRWLPWQEMDIFLGVDGGRDRSQVQGTTLAQADNPDVLTNGQPTPYDDRFIPDNPYVSYATYQDPVSGHYLPSQVASDTRNLTLNTTWRPTPSVSITSISAARSYDTRYFNDQDVSPLFVSMSTYFLNHDQISQELRVVGSMAPLDWTLGAYYYEAESRLRSQIAARPLLYNFNDNQAKTRSRSLFGELTWALSPRLNLTTGVRYTEDQKVFTFGQHKLDTHEPTFVDGLKGVYEGNATDYRVALDYRWNEQLMGYIQHSTGYKGGGVNPRPFVSNQVVSFGPETLNAFEVGLKSQWLNNSLRLNLALFFNRYQDIVLRDRNGYTGSDGVFFPSSVVPFNAGDADIKGLELEMGYYSPGGLFISTSLSSLNFQYTRLAADALTSNIGKNDVPPYTPERQVSLSLGYRFSLFGGTLTPRIDLQYQSESYADNNNIPEERLDGYQTTNAHLSWESPQNAWLAQVSITNLGNRRYYTTRFNALDFSGTLQQHIARPREVAVTLIRRFQ